MSEIRKCPNLVRGGGGQHFSKMSEIQKCPNLVRGGGGQHFSKMSEIQKYPKGWGEGSTLIGTLSQIFSIFYFDASPNKEN